MASQTYNGIEIDTSNFSLDFLRQIPKTDLHVHLDGSVRVQTLIELAQKENVTLPTYKADELNQVVFKDTYNDLEEYLSGFAYITAVLINEENLERVAYEFAIDLFSEGVRYFEVRFAPQLHASPGRMTIEEVLKAVHKGLNRAKEEMNKNENVAEGKEPQYRFGIIVSAMRSVFKELSPYYGSLFDLHPHASPARVASLAAFALVDEAIHCRDKCGVPICGFDIAGAEAGNPANNVRDTYRYAYENFLPATAHAGEAWGPDSVYQAVAYCHAKRIGHGVHLFSQEMLPDTVPDKQKYVENLVTYMATNRVTIEVCLSSNLQTLPVLQNDLDNHSMKKMLNERLSITLCTDNRTFSKTNSMREIALAAKHFDLDQEKLRYITMQGFKRSFMPCSYADKCDYLESIKRYYHKLERHYFGRSSGLGLGLEYYP
eukprot:GFYU01009271.1.p1 GENE.GFYU01009271.1~~GFYU01009271.1.p1  ORF type:complete len:431 (-),score=91.38 GFYU01009271.1:539-1831(-)